MLWLARFGQRAVVVETSGLHIKVVEEPFFEYLPIIFALKPAKSFRQ